MVNVITHAHSKKPEAGKQAGWHVRRMYNNRCVSALPLAPLGRGCAPSNSWGKMCAVNGHMKARHRKLETRSQLLPSVAVAPVVTGDRLGQRMRKPAVIVGNGGDDDDDDDDDDRSCSHVKT